MKNKLTFVFLIVPFLFISCRGKRNSFVSSDYLGTVCSVSTFDNYPQELFVQLDGLLKKIDSLFDVNNPGSEVSRINRFAGIEPVKVSREVFVVVDTAISVAQISDGAFDLTIGSAVDLWGINSRNYKVPGDEEVESVRFLVDFNQVEADRLKGTVFIKKEGMKIDLGGIAKGYAADCAAELLGTYKVKRAVLDFGGNIYLYGKKPDGSPWRTGIKNPLEKNQIAAVVDGKENISVVTSGGYERFFESDGTKYHHIIDPETCRPCENGVLSATAVGPSSIICDALSTAFFVGGESLAQKIIRTEAYRDYGYIIMTASENYRLDVCSENVMVSEN